MFGIVNYFRVLSPSYVYFIYAHNLYTNTLIYIIHLGENSTCEGEANILLIKRHVLTLFIKKSSKYSVNREKGSPQKEIIKNKESSKILF